MINLRDILLMFVMPIGITISLVVSGLVLRRKALCWTGIAVLWLASTSLVGHAIMRATEGWQVRQPLSAMPVAQAIVVLSEGRVRPPGDAGASEWTDADRFYGGVGLYKSGKAPILIFTGGWSPRQPNARLEGEVLIGYAMDLGIPRDRMLSTAKVQSTEQEAHAVADLLAARTAPSTKSRVLLVTSALHMRRARMLFARAGLETIAFPVDFKVSAGRAFTLLDLLPNAASLKLTETALRELYGFAFYWSQSRIS
ncbi:MAG: YdcF family protein [Burkholderiales bacterium]|nr:YdcF family protein [Burkholderiales bacterium]